jgi:hypothetical protein
MLEIRVYIYIYIRECQLLPETGLICEETSYLIDLVQDNVEWKMIVTQTETILRIHL